MITAFETYCCEHKHYDFFGLSTDDKPFFEVPNASSFYEMDTMRVWLFDAGNGVWWAQDGSGESVGGGK